MEIAGLTNEQVQKQVAAHQVNEKVQSSTKTISDIIKSNVFTYFNLIFAVLSVLLVIVRSWRDLTFLVVITANTLIGIVQEIHAKRVLDKLALLSAPRTTVIRDGREQEVPSEQLVKDDTVVLAAGNQIPADAVVTSGEVQVNEALITGEADEITKKKDDTLLSGSFVVSGRVTARLTKVGAESYISQLTLQATKSKSGEQSEMIRSLNRLIKVVGVLIIPIGILLFVQSFVYNGGSLRESVTGVVAAVIGMIPEGLYLLASVAMAVSTMRLAKKEVLVHDMKCIETLARVNVLCVDKTGTITEPGMQVYSFCPVRRKDAEGAECMEDSLDISDLRRLLSDFSQNMTADNATMEALQAYFTEGSGQQAAKICPFSSATKYSGAVLPEGSYVLGAPEFVLREGFHEYEDQITTYSSQGYRVLVFAEYKGCLDGKMLTEEAIPLGLVMLSNPIRKGARETFVYFAEHEVEIKVISGDNPQTVSVIAQEAGIRNAENYVDATELQSREDYEAAVHKYTVFGRVTPDQKRKLVHALKAKKKTVAMTGDGVNDVLALKDADCSVAMASGADAAADVSQLVLLDSDFTRMPDVVMEGRRVVNNIERSATLYLVKNIFSMLLAVFSVILMLDYPLKPAQLSLISMFTIGAPSFFLALEPNRNPIRGRFLTNVMLRALPAGLTDFLVVSALVLFSQEFSIDADCVSTACTVIIAAVGFMILYRIAKPMNAWHIILVSAMVAGYLFCIIFVQEFFAISSLSRSCAMLMILFLIAAESVFRYLIIIISGLRERYRCLKRRLTA